MEIAHFASQRSAERGTRRKSLRLARTLRHARRSLRPSAEGLEARSLLSVGLDPSFGFGGIAQLNFPSSATTATTFAVSKVGLDNGQIVAVGTETTETFDSTGTIVSTSTNLAAVRLNSDGSIDTTFGTNGIATIPLVSGSSTYTLDDAEGIAVQSNGQIVVLATGSLGASPDDFVVARLNSNGALDSSFGSSGLGFFNFGTGFATQPFDTAALAIGSNAQIVVAGSVRAAGTDDFAVARLTTSGSLDTTFNGTGLVTVPFSIGSFSGADATGVVVQPNGEIVVVGNAVAGTSSSTSSGQLTNIAVARLNVNGTLDTSFNSTGELTFSYDLGGTNNDTASAVTLEGTQIVIAGTSTVRFSQNDVPEIDNLTVSRLNSNGSFDTSFNGTGKYNVALSVGGLAYSTIGTGITVMPDGTLLAGGSASPDYSYNTSGLLVNLTTTGSLNPSYGSNGVAQLPESVSGALLVQSDGRVVFSSGDSVVRTTAPAPQVVSVSLVTTGTGKRINVSALTVQFNTNVKASLAANVKYYQVLVGTKGRKFLRLKSASYNANTYTVTLQVQSTRLSKLGYTVMITGSGIVKSGAALLDNGSVLSEYVAPTVTSARVAHQAARVHSRRI
jgi:uncharacterized delta-60 repeat protein